MKVKKAVEKLKAEPSEDLHRNLAKLYGEEAHSRIALRSHGASPSKSLVEGVMKEMDDWIVKVAQGVGLNVKTITALKTERSAIFTAHGMLDPEAETQMARLRRAYQRGHDPFEVLTKDGLDAMTNMAMGQMMQQAREYGVKLRPGSPFCPRGVEARFCKHQESYFDSQKGLPSGVKDIQFYCTLEGGPEKCDWKEAKDG